MNSIWKKLGNVIPSQAVIELYKLYIKIMMFYYAVAMFLDTGLRGNDKNSTTPTEQRRILRPQGRAASTRLQQPSWLSVLGMPAIFYILEYEKHGLLRFSVPLFVLIIQSYLL
ncbi:MAG: hypothetical protein JSS50_02310 [Proteobacteria bacterium]|nr:hypothetical protein [Pseudomonadota bacterium]